MLACPSGGTCVPLIAPSCCAASSSFTVRNHRIITHRALPGIINPIDAAKSYNHNNSNNNNSPSQAQTTTCVSSTCYSPPPLVIHTSHEIISSAVERFPSLNSSCYVSNNFSSAHGEYLHHQRHCYSRSHRQIFLPPLNSDCVTGTSTTSSVDPYARHSQVLGQQPPYYSVSNRQQYTSPLAHNYYLLEKTMPSSILSQQEQRHLLRPNFASSTVAPTPTLTSGLTYRYATQQPGHASTFGHYHQHHQAPPNLGQTLVTTAITATPIVTSYTVESSGVGRRHSHNPYATYSQNSASNLYHSNCYPSSSSSATTQHDNPSARMYQPQQIFTVGSAPSRMQSNSVTMIDLQQQRNAAPPSWPPVHASPMNSAPYPATTSTAAYYHVPPEYQRQPYAFNNYSSPLKSAAANSIAAYTPHQHQVAPTHGEPQNINYTSISPQQQYQQQIYQSNSYSASSTTRTVAPVHPSNSYAPGGFNSSAHISSSGTALQFAPTNYAPVATTASATFPPPNVSVMPPKSVHRQQHHATVPPRSLQQQQQQIMHHPHPYYRYQKVNSSMQQMQQKQARQPSLTMPTSYRPDLVGGLSCLPVNGTITQLKNTLGSGIPICTGEEEKLEAFQRFALNTELMRRVFSSDDCVSSAADVEPVFEKDLQSLRHRREQLDIHCQRLQEESDAEARVMQQTKADLIAKSQAFDQAWQSITPIANLQEDIDKKAAQYLLEFERQQTQGEEAGLPTLATRAPVAESEAGASNFIGEDERLVRAAEALLAMRGQQTTMVAVEDRLNDSGIENNSFQQS